MSQSSTWPTNHTIESSSIIDAGAMCRVNSTGASKPSAVATATVSSWSGSVTGSNSRWAGMSGWRFVRDDNTMPGIELPRHCRFHLGDIWSIEHERLVEQFHRSAGGCRQNRTELLRFATVHLRAIAWTQLDQFSLPAFIMSEFTAPLTSVRSRWPTLPGDERGRISTRRLALSAAAGAHGSWRVQCRFGGERRACRRGPVPGRFGSRTSSVTCGR